MVKRIKLKPKLWRVDDGFACFGLESDRITDKVVRAAPISGYSIGRNIYQVLEYYARRGAKVERVA